MSADRAALTPEEIDRLVREVSFGPDGLVTAVAREVAGGEVLMVAHLSEESLRRTLETGIVHYHSRSRGRLWKKGETSGHLQVLERLRLDCDGDAILMDVRQEVAACHAGYRSCFFREASGHGWRVVEARVFDPGAEAGGAAAR